MYHVLATTKKREIIMHNLYKKFSFYYEIISRKRAKNIKYNIRVCMLYYFFFNYNEIGNTGIDKSF